MRKLTYILFALLASATLGVASAQRAAIKTNVLGLAVGNLNVEASRMLAPKWSVHLGLEAKPFSYPLPAPVGLLNYVEGLSSTAQDIVELGTIKHTEHYTIEPSLRYWTHGVYNRGFFFGVHAVGTRFSYGDNHLNRTYRQGWGVGAGLSLGYNRELTKRLNLELEFGLAGLYRRYRVLEGETGHRYPSEYSGVIPMVSRLGVSLVYTL